MSRAEAYARGMIARVALPPTSTVTVDDLLAALATLGDTADEIADRLRALEIKGERGHASDCPIAVFIDTHLGVHRYAVGRSFIGFVGAHGWQSVATPDPVAEFIRHFDRGVYLDLVATAGEASA